MFNNPLKKYQQGGQVSQEQQQMLAAFVEWLPKRVKEFQGMQPEQIVEALNGMAKSPEGQKQVQAYMQQFQQEMQNTQAGMFKEGGKLQDFICKHAKGGHVAGCGCKEDGGKVNKTQRKQQGGFLPGDVNNIMVQDTTRRNSDGSISRIKIIASPNGDAARQTITGRDTTSVGGYWNDNRFIPDGDIVYDNNELENGIKALQQRPYYLGGARKASLDNGRNYLNQNRNVNPYRELENGGVVKGQEGLNIPAEPPTGYNGEIRQYIDRRNPIRRRIDTFVKNNPYARKIVSLGKGIKESPLGMLLPDFSNGVAGAVAPAGKISKISNLDKRSKAAMDRILSGYREYREDPFKAGMPDNFTGTYSYSTERPFGLSDDPFGFYNNGGVIKQNTKK